MGMMESYRGVVHPWLCDGMGHFTTRHYTAMFDDASYHLAYACGVDLSSENRESGFVDVKLEMNFLSELRSGALVIVHSGILKLGRTSFTARHEMRNIKDMSLAATLDSVSVFFDLKARKAMPIDDTFRTKAAALMVEG
ncbi:acyl-CoA thioesterase [Kordiimonas pumila]|uniref:Acyl-CoA thioesterase n=1 Tax=Kordiimonas pumila TaxID=2161677 RepID=A0ABV7D4F5_9PROT|nr:thioesterase family protein [Kordiimonas pumila]